MEEGAAHQGSGPDSIPCRPSYSRAQHGRSGQRSCKACGMTRLPSGYNEKYRICKACYQAPQLLVGGEGGQLMRFCQQCSKLQLLDDFDGDRRSCRHALERHASRRQSRQSRAARSPSPQPQPRPSRRPRLEQPAQQHVTVVQQQQQQQQHVPAVVQEQQQQQHVPAVVQEQQQHVPAVVEQQQQQAPAASVHVTLAPAAELEPAPMWPEELLQLAQHEQQQRQRQQQEGQPQQLDGGLGTGSLSLVVGHPTERMEITISLEPWLQSQPAPCPEGSSAGEPAVSARDAWQESLAALPAVRTSPFQQAAVAVPATTRCSSQSAATVAAAATTMTTMLSIPTPRGAAAALLMSAGSGNGSGCLSAAYAAYGALRPGDLSVHMPAAVTPDGRVMELTGSNSFRLSSVLPPLATAASGALAQHGAMGPAQLSPTAQTTTPQQLRWERQPPTLPVPLAPGQPPGTLGPRGSSTWGG